MNLTNESKDEPVFACNMSAIESSERARHIKDTAILLGRIQRVEEQQAGYTLEFKLENETLLLTTRFISLERLCCPFFSFKLEVEPAAKSFTLELAGPQGVKPFIMAELGLKVD